NGDITIDLSDAHGSKEVKPGDTIPEGLKDKDGHTVTLKDTRKEITRTIIANEPTGKDENDRKKVDLSQSGVVTRTFDYDPVTKTITNWSEWCPVSWGAVTVPDYAGYTATITDGEGHTLTSIDKVTTSDPSYKDPKISITYTANKQSVKYVFKDGNSDVLDGT
ncbi:mucin-binding protein, partial [Lactobacillus gallinarum]|uniref:mucin-binding protein n=1 Tax=Lactobacillus gallinarum TaxID=52242 RepID=UPI0024B8D230